MGVLKRYVENMLPRVRKRYVTKYVWGTKPLRGKCYRGYENVTSKNILPGGTKTLRGKYVTLGGVMKFFTSPRGFIIPYHPPILFIYWEILGGRIPPWLISYSRLNFVWWTCGLCVLCSSTSLAALATLFSIKKIDKKVLLDFQTFSKFNQDTTALSIWIEIF